MLARAKPIRLKKPDFSGFFYFRKKPKVFKKARMSKSGFQKGKLATLLHKN